MRILRRKALKFKKVETMPINTMCPYAAYKLSIGCNEETIQKGRLLQIRKLIKRLVKKLGNKVLFSVIIKEKIKKYNITKKGILVRQGKGKGKKVGEMNILKSNNKIFTVILMLKQSVDLVKAIKTYFIKNNLNFTLTKNC